MGGEKIKSGGPLDTARGSPPHRRGKVFLTDLVRIVVGITPAWAGKSPRLPDSKPAGKDHPRVGGEKIKAAARVGRCAGSPPRGRGKVRFVLLLAVLVGITPAWAGKSPCSSKLVNAFEDHPRVGGEKMILPMTESRLWGSPPRGRGKDKSGGEGGTLRRITPAWAGKSPVCALIGRSRWDHPRVGGEKYDCTGQEFTNWGSHPRRRGKEQPHH